MRPTVGTERRRLWCSRTAHSKAYRFALPEKSAAWYCRYKGSFYRLGDVGNPDIKVAQRQAGSLYAAAAANALSGELRRIIDQGLDAKTYLASRLQGKPHESAAAVAGSEMARAEGAWSWAKLVDEFIAKKISVDKISPIAVKPASQRTIKEVADILKHPDLGHLGKKLARDITRLDLEKVRDAWFDAGRKSAQRKLITYAKSAFKWARGNQAAAGLSDMTPWWLDLRHHAYASKKAVAKGRGEAVARTLTPTDIATLLFLAEKHRVLPGRKIQKPTADITLAFLWWDCLTVQRTHAAAAVRTASVIDRVRSDGWYEVSWKPGDMKSRRHHVLAIPPEIHRRSIGRALAADGRRPRSEWVFPSNRKGEEDKPVGDWILNNLLARMRGERDDEETAIDLLAEAGLPPFSPHAVRKGLATFLAGQAIPSGAASAILDHAIPADDEAEADVTRKHYNESLDLPLKFAGLTEWSEAVLDEYKKLLDTERTARFGKLVRAGRLRQIVGNLSTSDLWLFDRHIPSPPAAAEKIDLGKLAIKSVNDPSDDMDWTEQTGT